MCLLALFVTITTSAENYNLVVGGVTVTSSNASGVTGDNIKAFSSGVNGGKPSVVYNNSTKTLTLWNVKIERTGSDNRAILSGISGLTVVLKGNNYLKATGASPVRFNAQTTLKCEVYNGTGSSDIIGGTQDALTVGSGATLTITDADLFLQSSNSSAFDAENSPTLIIQNSNITAKGGGTNSNDNFGLRNYKELRINNSTVTLEGTSQAIKNLTTLTLVTGMSVIDPVYSTFYNNTVCNQSSLTPANPVTFAMGRAIDSTSFPDDNFRSYLTTTLDNNPKDGYLSYPEINAVKSMDLINKKIGNLKGIEYFTELTSINLGGNNLQTLDLSSNRYLKYLECISNSLTTLNLSQNTALTEIHCYRNRIHGNGAETFVNNLPTVTNGVIYFYSSETSTWNAMTAAQVATAKGKGWTVMWQNMPGATWTEYPGSDAIDIYETNFPDDNFRSYVSSNCDPNKDGYLTPTELKSITNIDVSDRGIKDLKGIKYFTALTKLYCNDNELSTLDVSKNTALTELYCHNNELSTLDVSKNTALTTLWCLNNKLTSLTLSKNSALTWLICMENRLQGTAMDQLIAGLPETTNGRFYVVAPYTPNEQNDVTSNQVVAARAKGWTTYYWTGTTAGETYGGEFIETAGSDALYIDVMHFPDENFRNWLLKQDYGKDGFLTPAELQSIKVMNLYFLGIKDLKGIEYFTAITELICSRNALSTLDVSKNTALTELNCSHNGLESLDVSKNTALTMLECSHNGLGILDLSKNTMLTYLDCNDNPLGTLDVSKNTALTQLHCYSNNLGTLDVSKNTALTNLYCYSNNLGTLDVSKNTALTELNCSNNELESLDVSKNTALTMLECSHNALGTLDVSKNTALTDLRCSDNALGTLDVSKNTALTELHCYSNNLGSLDVSKNTALTKLYCDSNNLGTLDVSKNSALKFLSCYDNQLRGAAMDQLIAGLPETGGKFYAIAPNMPTEQNVVTTAQVAAAKAKGWTTYYRTGTNPDEGKYVEYDGSPVGLAIDATNFPDETFRNWLLAQEYGKDGFLTDEEIAGVKEIDVSGFVTGGTIASLKGIEHFTALTSLNCYFNQITALDVSKNTALTTLNCYFNQITALDVSKNTALTTLLIGSNPLKAMPDLSQNTKLTVLDCSSLGLTKLDVSKLTALTELSCGSNLLKELDLEKLTALTTLNIENNLFETLDVSHNTALTSLNCTNNRLTTIDLSNNKSLNTLFCSVNRISGTGMTALVKSLPVISWTAPSGKFYVVDETNKSEYNVCSTVQMAIATSKRWSVYHNTGLWELYEGSAVEKGDANGDGIIDANDVDTLTAYILTGTLPPFVGDTDALDVDGSGTVDIVDLTRLISHIYSK